MTDVATGNKTEFWLHNGAAPGALMKLGEILDVPEFPSGQKELIKVTHMESGEFEEYISGNRRDGAETTITMNSIPGDGTDTLCEAAYTSGRPRGFKIVYWTGDAVPIKRQKTGSCLVRNYMVKNPMDDRRTAELTVKWQSATVDAVYAAG